MMSRCTVVCFSPTGSSRLLAEAVAQGTGLPLPHRVLDLTLPDARSAPMLPFGRELVIFSVPVHAGRVPAVAAAALATVCGNDSPAILLVVYGNRHYDDALLELKDLVSSAGFVPVAAGAFVAEHSLHTEARPMAAGRPDPEDLDKARRFGMQAMTTLQQGGTGGLAVPGAVPYKAYPPGKAPTPVSADGCALCGACVDVCPMGAISIGETLVTDQTACIFCQACVKKCPYHSRAADSEAANAVRERLRPLMAARREPELFFASA